MPAFFSDLGREVWLNCGLRAERGTVRTSTTRVTPCARSSSMNSSIGRVEWPTVRTGIASPTGSCRDSDFLGLVQQGEVVERGAAAGGVAFLDQGPLREPAPGADARAGFPICESLPATLAEPGIALLAERYSVPVE